MADGSKIEWTDSTWNPIRARNKATGGVGHFCVHISPGCEGCYAERMQPRFKNRVRYAKQDQGKVELLLDGDVLAQPLRWRKPRMVFVCSMTDLFGEWVPEEWIDRVFAVMALSPQHQFQVLTKRAGRMRDYVSENAREHAITLEAVDAIARNKAAAIDDIDFLEVYPYPNIWLGVSVEDQQRADERIPHLLDTPAAVRFVSAEPLLGPVDFTRLCGVGFDALYGAVERTRKIDWIIVGGESGPGARPMHPDWVRSIRNQCQAAGVACFFKQWGEFVGEDFTRSGWRYYHNGTFTPNADHLFDDGVAALRVGKNEAGAILDGREWRQFPP